MFTPTGVSWSNACQKEQLPGTSGVLGLLLGPRDELVLKFKRQTKSVLSSRDCARDSVEGNRVEVESGNPRHLGDRSN